MATIDALRQALDILHDQFADGDPALDALADLGAAVAELSAARARLAALAGALAENDEAIRRARQRVWWSGHSHEYNAAVARGEAIAILDIRIKKNAEALALLARADAAGGGA